MSNRGPLNRRVRSNVVIRKMVAKRALHFHQHPGPAPLWRFQESAGTRSPVKHLRICSNCKINRHSSISSLVPQIFKGIQPNHHVQFTRPHSSEAYRSPFIPETARESVRVEIQKGKSETSREQGKTKKESEAMPHSYISEYPLSTDVDPGIKTFLEDLYRTSDDPVAHEKYSQLFTTDAILIMGSKKAIGREGKSAF